MPGIIYARVLHVRLLIATFRWVVSLAVFFFLLVFSFPVAMAQSTVREVDASDLTSNHDAPSGDWDVSLAQTPFVLGLGGIGNSMDVMPFFHDGVWHMFMMQTIPQGIAHRTSRDLVHWTNRPLAIPGPVATGSVVEHEGQFYFFYTSNQTVHLAVSDDLDHWTIHNSNPLVTANGSPYRPENFRDPYVFFNESENQWWMLVATQLAGVHKMRSGCVGLFKSDDLLNWKAAESFWSPANGPHHECPQVFRHDNRWYLLTFQRQTRCHVSDSVEGPWKRTPVRDLGPHTALAGSRVAFDGKRWVSFPFLCARQEKRDLGDIIQAEVYTLPRELIFHGDGSITERPPAELIEAVNRNPQVLVTETAKELVGKWEISDDTLRNRSQGGVVFMPSVPDNAYLEADFTLPEKNMDASILFRTDETLQSGYQLTLRPDQQTVELRSFSYWDRDRVLLAMPVSISTTRALKLRLFISDDVMEAFVDDQVVLSSRIYKHSQGAIAIESCNGDLQVQNIKVRHFGND